MAPTARPSPPSHAGWVAKSHAAIPAAAVTSAPNRRRGRVVIGQTAEPKEAPGRRAVEIRDVVVVGAVHGGQRLVIGLEGTQQRSVLGRQRGEEHLALDAVDQLQHRRDLVLQRLALLARCRRGFPLPAKQGERLIEEDRANMADGKEGRIRFVHRQTLANAMRFTTVELADLDDRIRSAAEEFRSGLETARMEAIRRNTTVNFVPATTGWSVVVPGVNGGADQVLGGNGSDRITGRESAAQWGFKNLDALWTDGAVALRS